MNEPRMTLQFSVNGSEQIMELSPTRRLLDILRQDLGLTGPKEGCSIGRCWACCCHRKSRYRRAAEVSLDGGVV